MIPAGTRVKVYRNLHKKCFSVLDAKTNKLLMHVNHLVLKDVKLRVQPAGRERVRKEKRKNVHAYVVGTTCNKWIGVLQPTTYNPYEYDSFMNMRTGEAVHEAEYALFNDGRFFTIGRRS